MMVTRNSYNNPHFPIFFSENDKNHYENTLSWTAIKEVLQKHFPGE